jgi:hypothetical protein
MFGASAESIPDRLLVKELLTANQSRLRYPTAGGGTSGVVTFDVTGLQKVLQKTPECKHPGLTGQPKPDNEYSAIHSIIAIKKAELFYAAIHPDVGFTPIWRAWAQLHTRRSLTTISPAVERVVRPLPTRLARK